MFLRRSPAKQSTEPRTGLAFCFFFFIQYIIYFTPGLRCIDTYRLRFVLAAGCDRGGDERYVGTDFVDNKGNG